PAPPGSRSLLIPRATSAQSGSRTGSPSHHPSRTEGGDQMEQQPPTHLDYGTGRPSASSKNWDAAWASAGQAMSAKPWTGKNLSRRFVELTAVAINFACTNLDREGARRYIRTALDAGATRDEILTIIKMASVMSIHSYSVGRTDSARGSKSIRSDCDSQAR